MALKWDNSLLIGVFYIDELHKKLFDSINEILQLIIISEDKEKIEKKLIFFENYIDIHFREEELIHKKYQFFNYNKQRVQHEEFKRLFELLKRKFQQNHITLEFITDMEGRMTRWWHEHINNIDKDLEKFLKKNNKIIRY